MSSISPDADAMRWDEVREHLRLTTGEIALAHRGFGNKFGTPQVMMNPDDGVLVGAEDDVVVLTRANSKSFEIDVDNGRE
jgi:hypothetical protein